MQIDFDDVGDVLRVVLNGRLDSAGVDGIKVAEALALAALS